MRPNMKKRYEFNRERTIQKNLCKTADSGKVVRGSVATMDTDTTRKTALRHKGNIQTQLKQVLTLNTRKRHSRWLSVRVR